MRNSQPNDLKIPKENTLQKTTQLSPPRWDGDRESGLEVDKMETKSIRINGEMGVNCSPGRVLLSGGSAGEARLILLGVGGRGSSGRMWKVLLLPSTRNGIRVIWLCFNEMYKERGDCSEMLYWLLVVESVVSSVNCNGGPILVSVFHYEWVI